MKKFFISITVIFLTIGIFSTTSIVKADDEVSQLFKDFIDECFNDRDNVTVYLGSKDVTDDFFNKYYNMYSKGELLAINNAIEFFNYDITHEIDTLIPSTKASTTRSKTFKSYETKTVNGNKKEWTTMLYCKFTYNSSTRNITSISNPQLNVDFGEWGNAFTPRSLNVSTGKEQIGRLSVKYTCSNDVEATYDPPFLPASTWDFGNCSHSYTLSA
ncbi:hypothetical protein [Thomasclavelia cocleata]|uniref:hypothetical protein n=1 Tax=Thomasclavelia cocleata TaxID=69824 RepID=UPI0025771DB3|nr:hypothetical protein [Thomasclavelia cocleata]